MKLGHEGFISKSQRINLMWTSSPTTENKTFPWTPFLEAKLEVLGCVHLYLIEPNEF